MNRSNNGSPNWSITAGTDFLQLDTAEAPVGGLSAWLAERLRQAIADGRLPVGSRLPATRVLAGELNVSRGVVTEAYRRLAEDGQVVGRGRGGTIVVAAPIGARPPGPGPGLSASSGVFSEPPGLDALDALRAAPARIDLSPGVPDLGAFPRATWLRAERTVLSGLGAADLGYGDPRGARPLRRAVSEWLARNRGIRAGPDEVIVVTGTAQALALFGRVLGDNGIGEVAVEDPGSLGVRQHLRQWVATPPVPVDGRGVRVGELRASGAPAVLLTPAHQFPTGVVLDDGRRRELMSWAADGGLIIEDDYDAEHRHDRPPVPGLRGVLPEYVFYAGSVSKLLAPALRIGWTVVPRRYAGAVVAAKRLADLGNAALPQLVLADLMRSGRLERHLRLLRRRHRRRRDAMIEAIITHIPEAEVRGSAAGLHLMITFESDLDDAGLAAAALEHGVKVQPLSWHCRRPYPQPGLVLGYAAASTSAIEEGVAVLGRLSSSKS